MELLKFFKRLFGLGDIKIKKKKLSFINLKWSFLLFFIFLMPFFAFSQVNINSIDTGFRIPKNTASIGTEVDVHLVCKVIKNTSLVNDYFIPTKTTGEWTSFINAVPSITDLVISDCSFCAAGFYLLDSVCTCVGNGYYFPINNNSRYTCAAGTYCSGCSGSETTCAAGTASIAVSLSCTTCAAGSYNTTTGNSSCTTCPAGKYCTGGTSNVCCPDGKYNSATGQSSCTSCAAGTYGVGTCQTSNTCSSCSAGYYSSAGAASCSTCSAGTYSSSGSSSCSTCSCSTYSSAGSSSCSTGYNGYNCSTGSTSSAANACSSGYNSITSNCSYTCSGGYYDSNRDGNCEQVTGAYYSPANDYRRYACASGYTASVGSDASADCTIPI